MFLEQAPLETLFIKPIISFAGADFSLIKYIRLAQQISTTDPLLSKWDFNYFAGM